MSKIYWYECCGCGNQDKSSSDNEPEECHWCGGTRFEYVTEEEGN